MQYYFQIGTIVFDMKFFKFFLLVAMVTIILYGMEIFKQFSKAQLCNIIFKLAQ